MAGVAPTLAGGLTGAVVPDRAAAGEPTDDETADEADETGETDDEADEAGETDDEAGETDDEAAENAWDEAGILPVSITLPSGTGYTLRTYVDDEPRFLGTDLRVYVFRSADGLVEFCRGEDEHELTDLETWPLLHEADAAELPVAPGDEDTYDLTAPSPEAIELSRDLADYCQLAGVQAALRGRAVENGVPFDVWVAAVAEIDSCVRWQD